ncbi:unnamed protein product [Urochloa decumbens]|uniref:Probable purine permease n=1 Tax=Urochloa decumbens TaxID=240449 RepID=A0ABC9ETP3_9POAL
MEVETPAPPQPCKDAGATRSGRSCGSACRLLRNPILVVNFVLMVFGTAGGPLFLRAYFLRGGTRKWLSAFLQTAGFPILLVPLFASFSQRRRRQRRSGGGGGTPFFLMTPRLLAASAGIGVMTGLDDLLYAYGLAYLPVSTSSILISTQLAFTAGFALLLVRQRFTAFSVNAVALLSVGAAMLGMNAGGDRPAGVSRAQYGAGFAMTLGAAALFGLVLPVMERCQARHAARPGAGPVTYTLVIEMQLVIGLTATVFTAVGMLVNNDFHAIPEEARQFGFGRSGYYLLLAGSAATYQCFFLGTIGAIFFGSALLSGVIMTVLIPVTEVLAVMLFNEPFNGTKGVALVLSLWGFVSYFYGEVQTAKANHQSENNPPIVEQQLDP